MKKTRNFDEYMSESIEGLIPLDSEEIIISEEEEDDFEDLESEDDEKDENELPDTEEFELDTVPTDEPVLEPADSGEPEDEGPGEDILDVPEAPEELVDEVEGDIEELGEMPIGLPETSESSSKTVYLYCGVNAVDGAEDPVFNAVEEIKEMFTGCECEVIKLYQLNIQPVSDPEPADGMQMIYDHIQDADIVIIASPIQDGNVSSLATLVMDRLSQHYQSKELSNKIFGSILAGDDSGYQNVKSNLNNKANNLGMLIPGDSNILVGGEGADFQKFVDDVIQLRDATSGIRTAVGDVMADTEASDVLSFDEFTSGAEDVADELAGPELEDDLPVDAEDITDAEEDVVDAAEDLVDTEEDVLDAGEDAVDSEEDVLGDVESFEDFMKNKEGDEEPPAEEDNEELNLTPPHKPDLKGALKGALKNALTDAWKKDAKQTGYQDEEEEIEIVEEKSKIMTFEEMQASSYGKDEELDGTSKMGKTSVDPEKGAKKLHDVKTKNSTDTGDGLKFEDGTTRVPKPDSAETHGATSMDANMEVDVKYFSGKGKKGSEKGNKPGDGVENFADWTKRV